MRSKRPAPGLIMHSDRGSQYCADDYRKLVAQFGMRASMSRKGNCYDNAPMESFWGSLKNEMIHHQRHATRANAQSAGTLRGPTRNQRARYAGQRAISDQGVYRDLPQPPAAPFAPWLRIASIVCR